MSGGAFRLLDAVTAIGAGPSIFLSRTRKHHTVQVSVVDADTSISALVIDLEGSLDNRGVIDVNAKWSQMSRHTFTGAELTALFAAFVTTDQDFKRVRLNVITATGIGSGDTITAKYLEGAEHGS